VVSRKNNGDEVEGVCGLDRNALSVRDCRTESGLQILWSRGGFTHIQFVVIVIHLGYLYRLGCGRHYRGLVIAS
jgi:hypothetical protein